MIIFDGSVEKKLHKDILCETIVELCKEDKDVVLLNADLMNSTSTTKFWKENPDQAINCGIAEANMIGIAAGLSAVGKKPYAHSFGPFASRRCYDQVFLSGAYAKNSMRVIGTDAGVTAAFNGGTHMPFEDMALMRAIPECTVLDISDGVCLKSMLKQTKDRAGVTYLRTTRKSNKAVYSDDQQFTIGKANVVREGKDVTIIACGIMVGEALSAAEMLKAEGIEAKVVDMFTVKPIDEEIVIKSAKETGAIVTAENHNVIGGLADAVGAVLLANKPVPVERVGVFDRFGQVGPQDFLQKEYGLTPEKIVEAAKKAIARKG